jgi:3-hydroxybutyryl-CoA dehydrogenase
MTAADPGLRRAAIVGAGRMGAGIAESFITEGFEVVIVDATPEQCDASRERLLERMRAHAAAGLIAPEAATRAQDVTVAHDISTAVHGADLVIEAVTEDTEVKREVLGVCDRDAPADAIIASNTSSLDINVLAGFVSRPERFLGMHWFNPPEWTPGVEVIPAAATRPEIVSRVVALLQSIGKRPSVVSSSVGFIANRLQMALFCEAARCVEEGLASPRDIDEVVRSCFGFRLPYFGPFQIADMAGLDVYKAVIEQHQQGFGGRFEVPGSLRRLVDEGHHGTATGGGFYDYAAGSPEVILVERDRRYAALSDLLKTEPPIEFNGGDGRGA